MNHTPCSDIASQTPCSDVTDLTQCNDVTTQTSSSDVTMKSGCKLEQAGNETVVEVACVDQVSVSCPCTEAIVNEVKSSTAEWSQTLEIPVSNWSQTSAISAEWSHLRNQTEQI